MDFDERIIPDETEKGIIATHLKLYVFAGEFCRLRRVLDVACGSGYGTHYLAAIAREAIGVDRSREAIEYAVKRYVHPRATFAVMDACALTFQDQTFDVVCSFETIEHLEDVETYLAEVRRVLKSDGLYLVSTPWVQRTTDSPENPFHHREWSPTDFKALLDKYFASVKLFSQRRKQTVLHRLLQKADVFHLRTKIGIPSLTRSVSYAVGTTPFMDMSLDDFDIVEGDLNGATRTIGVCARSR